MLRAILLTVALSLSAVPVAADTWDDAVAAYGSRDYETAMRLFRPFAEQGNADAQYNLGVMYNDGEGVAQDYGKAVHWYRKAADQDDAVAQAFLGLMYYQAAGLEKNDEEAASWFRKAIANGYEPAKGFLREMRWDWNNDVNGDGKVTISDVGGWLSWVFFWPGDWIIELVIENASSLADFFELTDDPFKGVLSGILSGFIWFLGLLIWGVGARAL